MSTQQRCYSGPNDPRFAQNSGFFEIFGMGGVGGALAGYIAGWEGVGLYKTGGLLSPHTLFAAIHAAGILPHAYLPALAAGAGLGAVAGGVVGFFAGNTPHELHIRGRQLTHNPKAAARALRPARKSAPGVSIHPQIPISEAQEARHMLLLGGSGSGKTSILWPVINQAVERGDRALIFSFKGDFQQKAEFPFSLLAPWDSRSVRWQLGRDIRTRLHAESLAKTLIPTPDKDPVWAQGAQGLLTAIISEVQSKYGEKWGFYRLAQACSVALSDYDSLVQTVMRESPLARSFLMGKDSKTTASYLAQMASNLSDVVNLGVADWSNNQGKPWSVRDWLAGKSPGAAILAYMSESAELSRAFCSSIIEQCVKQILAFPDASPDARRIWLFLDEVPQAGKIPSITDALETARSKGCRVVLGMQGVAQLEEHGYSKNTLRIWAGQSAVKIIANLSDPDDQKWASNLLGDRDLERYQSNISTNSNGQGGNSGQSGGYQRATEAVMLPASFGTDLFVDESKGGGPTALIVTAKVAAMLKWPFPPLQSMRDAFVPAQWTLHGFQRPVWGKTPPQVGDGAIVPPVKPEAKTQQKTQTPGQKRIDDIIYMPNEQQQAQALPDAGGAGEAVEEAVADHMIGAALDAAITGGAGELFEIMKGVSELAGGGNGGVSAMIPQPQPRAMREAEAEYEDEEEAEA